MKIKPLIFSTKFLFWKSRKRENCNERVEKNRVPMAWRRGIIGRHCCVANADWLFRNDFLLEAALIANNYSIACDERVPVAIPEQFRSSFRANPGGRFRICNDILLEDALIANNNLLRSRAVSEQFRSSFGAVSEQILAVGFEFD